MMFLAHLLVRYRCWSFGVLALLTAIGAWRAANLDFDFSFRRFFSLTPADDDLASRFRRELGNLDGSSLVAVLTGDDVFRRDVVEALDRMSDEIRQIPAVDRVVSISTVPILKRNSVDLDWRPLPDLFRSQFDPDEIRHAVLSSPLYARRLVSREGRTTVVLAVLDEAHTSIAARQPTIDAFRHAVERHRPAGFTEQFTGFPIAEAEYARLAWRGFLTAEMVGVLVMSLALFACFRTATAVLLPLTIVGAATVLTLGFMEISGHKVTLINASIPLLLLVIGIAEVSFFLARYYEAPAAGNPNSTAHVVQAMGSVLAPGAIAAATTSAGFASLMAGSIAITRDFGMLLAAGVLITFGVIVFMVPAVLSLLPVPHARERESPQRDLTSRILNAFAAVSLRMGWAVFAGAMILIVLGSTGAAWIRVDQYATRELPPEHPIRAAQGAVDSDLMGAFQTRVGIRPTDGLALLSPPVLKSVEKLQAFLVNDSDVIGALSVADYLKEFNFALEDSDAALNLPETEMAARQLLLLGETSFEVPDLINLDRTLATIAVGTTDLGTGKLAALHERTVQFVRDHLGDTLEFRFLGDYWSVSEGANSLARDLLVSTLLSGAIVFALVGFFLRSWKLTLLSLPTNLLPLCIALGLMGFADLNLRVGTSIILPISLAIAVDATVHCLARIRHEWSLDRDYDGAVRRALLGTGRGMLFSSIVLIAGFLCFLIPEFLVFHHVGIVASTTLFVALLADLFLLPSLVLSARPLGHGPAPAKSRPLPTDASGTGGRLAG